MSYIPKEGVWRREMREAYIGLALGRPTVEVLIRALEEAHEAMKWLGHSCDPDCQWKELLEAVN